MAIGRREFVGTFGASIAGFSILGKTLLHPASQADSVIERKGWRLMVSPAGEIRSFTDGRTELVNRRLQGNRPRLVVADLRVYECENPIAVREDNLSLNFEYQFSGDESFSLQYAVSLEDLPGNLVALRQSIKIRSSKRIVDDVKLILPRNLQLPFQNRKVFVPLKNGIGRLKPITGFESADEYAYSMAGSHQSRGKTQPLAIPLVDESADGTNLHLSFCTDPFFSSYIFLPCGDWMGEFNCVYLGTVGFQGTEERTFFTVPHQGDSRTAMDVFYAAALSDVKPGPAWLHDIAMVDYDYLSKNGRGWFADIDALSRLINPPDRHKVFLALHGWYDYVGRYTFNPGSRALARRWTAFPSALEPRVQALGDHPRRPGVYGWRKRSVAKMRPVPMSIADVHHRIQYARNRGFRVGLYYADGTNACQGLADIFDPEKVLHWGGWVGPDTKGETYAQNPLHPGVRSFYLSYMDALLEEYGKDVDGFIWDETFTVASSDLGPSPYTGYASRAMMTLVRDVASKVASFSPRLAFFTSDDIGVSYGCDSNAPYSIVAHGTYQDSACAPVAWPYGLFPNYRNVLWSCNWAPVTRFEYTRYGVETFDAPVAISNGANGDDMGISDMRPEMQKRVVDLFEKRKRRLMEISWINEESWNPKYNGKPVAFRWEL